MVKRTCLDCGEIINGRIDKLFCSHYCKSSYHYKKNKEKEATLFKKIDKQLKSNRRILKKYNLAGKATIRKPTLLEAGFDPNYFTHYWKAKNGNLYLFVYEYGFMHKIENGREKFVLVQWQHYMEQK